MELLDKLRNWVNPKKPDPVPEPTPTPEPDKNPPGVVDYLKAWRLLKDIPFRRIWPALVSVPVIAFFAVSGLAAWLFFLFGFACRMIGLGAGN